jgi:hypothetical protein
MNRLVLRVLLDARFQRAQLVAPDLEQLRAAARIDVENVLFAFARPQLAAQSGPRQFLPVGEQRIEIIGDAQVVAPEDALDGLVWLSASALRRRSGGSPSSGSPARLSTEGMCMARRRIGGNPSGEPMGLFRCAGMVGCVPPGDPARYSMLSANSGRRRSVSSRSVGIISTAFCVNALAMARADSLSPPKVRQ